MKLKIKGSSSFFTIKKIFTVNIAALIICAALRVYHVFALIEPETGFFTEKNLTVYIFYAVFAFACIFSIVGAYLAKDALDISAESVNGNIVLGIISLLLAASFFLDFGYCFIMLDNASASSSLSQGSAFASMMKSASLPRKAQMLFGALSFVYFLILAVKIFTKKYNGQLKIFSLSTVFWGVSRLVTLFVKQISFVQVSDLFLEIAGTVFMTLFFFSMCECLSGVYKNSAQWRIAGIGLPAALTCLTMQIPRIAAAVSDNINYENVSYKLILVSDDYILNYIEMFVGVLVIALMIIFRNRTVKQITETENR